MCLFSIKVISFFITAGLLWQLNYGKVPYYSQSTKWNVFHFQVQVLDVGGTVTDNIWSFFVVFNRVKLFYKRRIHFCMCVCCCHHAVTILVIDYFRYFLPRDKCIYSTYFPPTELYFDNWRISFQTARSYNSNATFVIPFLKVLLSSLVWKSIFKPYYC